MTEQAMQDVTAPQRIERRDAVATVNARMPAPALALSRTWAATNLIAVACCGAAFAASAGNGLLTGWATFTVLNALLHLASREGVVVGRAAAHSTSFNCGLAAMLGVAWGGAVVLLLPLASAYQGAVLAGSVSAVAVLAIPALGAERTAFGWFLSTLTGLALAGVVRAGHVDTGIAWILLTALVLFLVASVYHRAQARLVGLLNELLAAHGAGQADIDTRVAQDADLGRITAATIASLARNASAAERDRRLLEALGDAIVTTDVDGVVTYLNPVAEVLVGAQSRTIVGQPIENTLRITLPPDQRNHAREIFDQTRMTRRMQQGSSNAQLARRDGVIYGVDYRVTAIRDGDGEFAGAAFLLRDVTEKRREAESIAWQATHDPLTGAINRAEFELRLKRLVRRAQDDMGHEHALLYIDIDKFKFINDSYGHAAGDAALKMLADVLRTRIRGADTLARIGGDEFAALLYSCGADKARLIAEGLRIAVERHDFTWQGIELPLSLSIGIVEINRDCRSTAEMVRAADSACFTAKKFGRNRVHLFDEKESNGAPQARVFDFVKDIQTAIHGNRLELFYQPLYATAENGDARRCELSVGVRDQAGEMIPRNELSDLARRYQLTEEIDRWVVKAALDALRLNHPVLCDMELVLVPLSQQSLADERLLGYITQLVKESPDQAQRLGFSLEDAAFATHLEYIRYFVSVLRQRGCRFMIGDIGFGGHAFETVKQVQADYLAIRAALVQNMLHCSADYEVVLGLSRVARALGMQTIAEKADTQSLRDALTSMGVDYTLGLLNEAPRRVSIFSEAQWI